MGSKHLEATKVAIATLTMEDGVDWNGDLPEELTEEEANMFERDVGLISDDVEDLMQQAQDMADAREGLQGLSAGLETMLVNGGADKITMEGYQLAIYILNSKLDPSCRVLTTSMENYNTPSDYYHFSKLTLESMAVAEGQWWETFRSLLESIKKAILERFSRFAAVEAVHPDRSAKFLPPPSVSGKLQRYGLISDERRILNANYIKTNFKMLETLITSDILPVVEMLGKNAKELENFNASKDVKVPESIRSAYDDLKQKLERLEGKFEECSKRSEPFHFTMSHGVESANLAHPHGDEVSSSLSENDLSLLNRECDSGSKAIKLLKTKVFPIMSSKVSISIKDNMDKADAEYIREITLDYLKYIKTLSRLTASFIMVDANIWSLLRSSERK